MTNFSEAANYANQLIAKYGDEREGLQRMLERFEAHMNEGWGDAEADVIAVALRAFLFPAAPQTISARIEAAREAGDWDLHAKLWDERNAMSVDADEACLAELTQPKAMNAYRISNSKRLEKGDAISARRNGRWQRAFFVRVIDSSAIDGVFDGDLVVRFEGAEDESYVRPHGAHDVMIRA